MKIKDIRTAEIQANFSWNLIRVYSDTGLVGLGEAYWGPGVMDVVAALKTILVGEDPFDVDRLWTKMMYGHLDVGPHRMRTMEGQDIYDRYGMSAPGSVAGATVAAISGIEIALLDLVGKALKTPVYQLLGGKFRERVRVYAASHAGETHDADAWCRRAAKVLAGGFDAIKFDVDDIAPELQLDGYNRALTNRAIDRIVDVVSAVRDELGPDVDLALDCHWQYNVTDAIRLANALEPLRLFWLEDPTPPDNADAMAQVRAATSTVICTGENLYTRHGFRHFIERGACDIIQPDIPRCGGLLESKRIADLADMHYVPFAAHNVCSPVGTVASAHCCAAIRTFTVLEFHAQDIPWWDDMVTQTEPIIHNGYIALRDAPGLGLELNDDVCRKHVKVGGDYFGEAV